MSTQSDRSDLKPLEWVGSSRTDLIALPAPVRRELGHALYLAQSGEKPPNAKPLKGFGGASVLEIVDQYDGNSYRAVYTVRFSQAVYVLHAFQKKSKHGIGTPTADIDLIKRRLTIAAEHYHQHYESDET